MFIHLSQVMFIHDVQVKLQPLPRPPSTRLSPLKKDTNYSDEVIVQSFLKPIKMTIVLMLA